MHSIAGYVIRRAAPVDLALLGAIEKDAAELYREVGYDFCAEGPVRDAWELDRALHDGTVLLAVAPDGAIAAFALVWPLDGEAHLLELAVARAHQKHGLGRRLLAAAEDWARSQGYAAMTLVTYRDVPWNAPVYARHGYAPFEPGPGRTGLAQVQAEERASGYAVKPRVAMRKVLS
jgi:GNAT superfamily N-acetyltransferase